MFFFFQTYYTRCVNLEAGRLKIPDAEVRMSLRFLKFSMNSLLYNWAVIYNDIRDWNPLSTDMFSLEPKQNLKKHSSYMCIRSYMCCAYCSIPWSYWIRYEYRSLKLWFRNLFSIYYNRKIDFSEVLPKDNFTQTHTSLSFLTVHHFSIFSNTSVSTICCLPLCLLVFRIRFKIDWVNDYQAFILMRQFPPFLQDLFPN